MELNKNRVLILISNFSQEIPTSNYFLLEQCSNGFVRFGSGRPTAHVTSGNLENAFKVTF